MVIAWFFVVGMWLLRARFQALIFFLFFWDLFFEVATAKAKAKAKAKATATAKAKAKAKCRSFGCAARKDASGFAQDDSFWGREINHNGNSKSNSKGKSKGNSKS